MSESLARFRDLQGIGPATEARLHEAGIYTWEALDAAASALAAVRGNGDTLREVAGLVAARRSEAEGQAALRLPGGERLEAFILRMTLAADGEPTSVASHAGTGHPVRELALRFPAVQLPAGVYRLQLRLEVNLPASAAQPPALALAGSGL